MNGSITKILAIFFLSSLSFLSFSSEQEVLDTIYKWSALESDLDAQSELIRDDRVMITSKRWPNQKENLMIQKERRAANLSRDPDSTLISTISSPVVRIYGEVAIADFVRRTDPKGADKLQKVEDEIKAAIEAANKRAAKKLRNKKKKKDDPEKKADGGRIGLKDGMDRRSFLKIG